MLRAECPNDVEVAVHLLSKSEVSGKPLDRPLYDYDIEQMSLDINNEKIPIPDTLFTFHSDLSLEQIIEVLAKIEDGHVMLETVNLADKYTGERDYDRSIA